MRRILVTAGLMAGLIGATTVPAAAQGWGYAGYGEPWGPGVGVSVGGVGVGIGAPADGAYAADYGYEPRPGYAYSAAPCSCGTAASYGSRSYVRGYRPSYYAAESSYAYDPGYADSYAYSRPGYGYEARYTYGERVGYGWRGSRVAARGEIQENVRRDTVRSASMVRERSAVRAMSRDRTVGVRERSGTGSVRADSATTMGGSGATMRGPSTDGRGGNVGSAPQGGGELRTGTTGRGGAASRMNDQGGAERR
jgi:hypothetical protein